MKNIEELNATIEELEKRIKAISSAGATLAQIIAVRDSLEQVKVCLNNLTTAIKDEEDDASVAQLTALEQRVTTAETDITTLQTDLTSTQDDLETVWNNLASTNSVVGEHTTTLTNLQTAQTNLQTTQTNQASTITTNTTDISNLKTRMTTAEANIGALTNGIDVGTLEDRITALEGKKIYITEINIRKDVDYNYINNVYFRLISSVKINSMEQAIKNIGLINRHATGYILGNPVIAIHRQSDTQIGIIYSIPYETGKYNNATSVMIDISNSDWKFFLNSIEI